MTVRIAPVIDRDNWLGYAAAAVVPTGWTAVIAAAGKGTRLGYHLPKVLYPVAGRTILDWLLDLVTPVCWEVVFVLSPDGRADVQPVLERLVPGRYRIAIQENPTGMGDAVQIGTAIVETPQVAILWGDQVALRPGSVAAITRIHAGPLQPDLTVPTLIRDAPYIHFERHADGRVAGLLQAREGDAMPAQGESDTGFFCFRTEVLRRLLTELRDDSGARGSRTAEFNLLPVVPFAANRGYTVLTPHLVCLEETIGINSPADAEQLDSYLRTLYA